MSSSNQYAGVAAAGVAMRWTFRVFATAAPAAEAAAITPGALKHRKRHAAHVASVNRGLA
jgi:hypothetical protein